VREGVGRKKRVWRRTLAVEG